MTFKELFALLKDQGATLLAFAGTGLGVLKGLFPKLFELVAGATGGAGNASAAGQVFAAALTTFFIAFGAGSMLMVAAFARWQGVQWWRAAFWLLFTVVVVVSLLLVGDAADSNPAILLGALAFVAAANIRMFDHWRTRMLGFAVAVLATAAAAPAVDRPDLFVLPVAFFGLAAAGVESALVQWADLRTATNDVWRLIRGERPNTLQSANLVAASPSVMGVVLTAFAAVVAALAVSTFAPLRRLHCDGATRDVVSIEASACFFLPWSRAVWRHEGSDGFWVASDTAGTLLASDSAAVLDRSLLGAASGVRFLVPNDSGARVIGLAIDTSGRRPGANVSIDLPWLGQQADRALATLEMLRQRRGDCEADRQAALDALGRRTITEGIPADTAKAARDARCAKLATEWGEAVRVVSRYNSEALSYLHTSVARRWVARLEFVRRWLVVGFVVALLLFAFYLAGGGTIADRPTMTAAVFVCLALLIPLSRAFRAEDISLMRPELIFDKVQFTAIPHREDPAASTAPASTPGTVGQSPGTLRPAARDTVLAYARDTMVVVVASPSTVNTDLNALVGRILNEINRVVK